MKIFNEIKDSTYNPSYYNSFLKNDSLKSSIKYLAKLSLIIALLGTLVFSFFIPKISSNIQNVIISSLESYPADLVLSVKNGVASINKPEPYIVTLDKKIKDGFNKNQKVSYDNIVVIDTKTPFSLEQFQKYSSFILLTKTELISVKDSSGSIQIMPLSKFGNFEISKAWLLEKESWFFNILPKIILAIVPLIYIILFLMNFSGTLLVVFLYAFMIWLMSKVAKVELSYKKSYILGLHLATPIIIFNTINLYLGLPANIFLQLIAIMLLAYVNFFKNYKKDEELPVATN